MKELKIEYLAYLLKQAKENNDPQPIFFLGAGASHSGNIPLAGEIIDQILKKYVKSPFIKGLQKEDRTYANLMACLLPAQRDKLLKNYINNAKINVTHIYLAQLLKEGFADYILTVNFDNLMLRALALFNIFPATYDMAILKDLTTTTFKKKSVVYLHGQSHGLWLLNTKEEMAKVQNTVPRIFDSIKNKRPWVVIGYSGEDPIFEYIKNLGRFDNGLYWITYNDNNPIDDVQEFIKKSNTNASIIKGHDSDSFMLTLNRELGLGQPNIIDKPFTALQEMLNAIVDIDDKEFIKGVKERLEISKKQVKETIQEYEQGFETSLNIKENKIDLFKREIINLVISEQYDANIISDIETRIKLLDGDPNLQNILSVLYTGWGAYLANLAKTKEGKEAEELYYQAFEKYQKSTEIKPDAHDAFYSWGTDLGQLAKTKKGKEADDFYHQSFHNFQKAIKIKPDFHEAFNNWGVLLGYFAKTKARKEAYDLYQQAFDKYQNAIEIKPNKHEAYDNWGIYLKDLADTRTGNEADDFYLKSFEKFRKATEIKPDFHNAYNNWGNSLGNLAKRKKDKEADDLYVQSFQKFQRAIEIKPDDNETYKDWATYLGDFASTKIGSEADKLYDQSFQKFQKAIELNPDFHNAYNNWGIILGNLATNRKDKEADELYFQSFQKFQRAISIKPDNYEAYSNWGKYLGCLAKTKEEKEAEVLFHQAFDKFQEAIQIEPDNSTAYYNWGIYLGCLVKTNTEKDADKLYQQAFEKFQKATEINHQFYDAYDIWGLYLVELANSKAGQEADDLYNEAFEKYQKAIELGGPCYNLACWHALKGNTKEALSYLDLSLTNKEIAVEFVEKDNDWKELLQNKEFINILSKHRN